MAIGWNSNINRQFDSDYRNDGYSFQEHNERMRTFCLAHPKNGKQQGQNLSEVEEDLLALVPIREVVLTRYLLN